MGREQRQKQAAWRGFTLLVVVVAMLPVYLWARLRIWWKKR